jgi:ABC-type phosphate transport system substrate-binding protein
MAKRALLIGVNEYKVGLAGLSSPIKNVEALREILEDQNGYRVSCLPNPSVQEMRREIELFFLNNNLERDDLGLLFFSGHGLKDDHGDLYFAATDTEKVVGGELRQATAIYAIDIQRWLKNSKCRRKVIILDCCFSGAFPRGLRVFGDNKIDFAGQLLGSLREEEYGGRGIVILTSSSAIEHSYEREGLELSIYTHYLVEGLKTGSADIDQDRRILAKELHDYVSDKVSQEESLMTPQIFRVNEGGEIVIAEVKRGKEYEGIVQNFVKKSGGKISDQDLKLLRANAHDLGLSDDEALKIEEKVLKPFQEHEKNLNDYRKHFRDALKNDKRYPFTPKIQEALKPWQKRRELKDEEIEGINRSEILEFYEEELKQIVSDAETKTRKEVQKKADELRISFSLTKQDVQNINNRLSQNTNILANVFKLFKYSLFYVFGVVFLVIAYQIIVFINKRETTIPDPPILKITDVKALKITDVKTPEGSFSYTTSSTWAPVVCDGKGIDAYITNKGKFKLSKAVTNIHSSNTAFDNLIDKDKNAGYAFAIISSDITQEMEDKAREQKIELGSMIVAKDAIAFGVNVNLNITDGLTYSDLEKIYLDGEKKWSNLTGEQFKKINPSLEIKTIFRPFTEKTLVGTTKYFLLDILGYKSLDEAAKKLTVVSAIDTSAAIGQVKNEEGSIYFATATELYGKGIQIVPIQNDSTKKFEAPYKDKDFKPEEHCQVLGDNIASSSNRNSNILNQNYRGKFIRPISVVWRKYNNTSGSDKDKNNEEAAIAYAKMLTTKEGQEILMGMGYFPSDYK